MPHLSTLEVLLRHGAIQIHVYLTFTNFCRIITKHYTFFLVCHHYGLHRKHIATKVKTLPLMPQPPSIQQVLISCTPTHNSMVFGIIYVNAAVSSDDSSCLYVAWLVNISLHETRTIWRHSYKQDIKIIRPTIIAIITFSTDGGPPWCVGGAYGLQGSCRFRLRNPKGRSLLRVPQFGPQNPAYVSTISSKFHNKQLNFNYVHIRTTNQ